MEPTQFQQKYMMVGEIRMTLQAYIICILGIFMGACLFALAMYLMLKGKYIFAVNMLFSSMVVLAIFLYVAYVTNCTVVGQCHVLSWIMVVLYMAFVVGNVFTFISALTLLTKHRK